MSKESINFIKMIPTENIKKESIIMFHGWGSTIESQKLIGEELSKLGFTVYIPEIVYHDNRGALENHFEKDVVQTYFWKTIFESIEDEKNILKSLNVQRENTILFGSSMGGFIASGLFFSNNEYAGLINVNGSSSFIASEVNFRELDMRKNMSEEEIDLFGKYDPIRRNLHITKPIIFLHGENDQIVPIIGQRNFVSHCQKVGVLNSIQFLTYKDVNHTITNEMISELKNWLKMNFE